MKANITLQQYLSLQEENLALKAQLSEIREDFAALQSQLNWLKNQLFGQKSERTEYVLPVGEQLPFIKG